MMPNMPKCYFCDDNKEPLMSNSYLENFQHFACVECANWFMMERSNHSSYQEYTKLYMMTQRYSSGGEMYITEFNGIEELNLKFLAAINDCMLHIQSLKHCRKKTFVPKDVH